MTQYTGNTTDVNVPYGRTDGRTDGRLSHAAVGSARWVGDSSSRRRNFAAEFCCCMVTVLLVRNDVIAVFSTDH